MGIVALKALPIAPTPDGYAYFDQITFSSGTPPVRPGGPRPTHPISLPGDPWWGNDPWLPHPSHPIALPGDPWWGNDGPQPGERPSGRLAVVRPLPPNAPEPTSAPDARWMQIIMEKGSPPTFALVNPYASTGPIGDGPAPE